MTHVHLIGIGGTGLSAIAHLLLESGYTVSGSDRSLSPLALRVQAAGAQVFAGHRAENVRGADLVVRSSAVPESNVEVQAARAAGIPVLKRADFLGRLMIGRQGIAVAGSHGKTTTTAMLAWVLTELGQDPSYIIGGVSANLGGNARAGRGPAFVIEADEYDGMFLGLSPTIAVVTNVEHDHPDQYPTAEDFYAAFAAFLRRLAPDGALIACEEDPGAARLLAEARNSGWRAISYGIGDHDYDYQAREMTPNAEGGYRFVASGSREGTGGWKQLISLQVPGLHNVRNALAVLAVIDRMGLPIAPAAEALGRFAGTGRRFELRGQAGGVTVIDDYAHHPTEIRATLSAARARFPGSRVWAVWQPHTYSRTRTLLAGFSTAFTDADQVVVTDIYAAREAPPEDGFSAAQVVAALAHPAARFVPSLEETAVYLIERLQPGDVVLVLSAGDADQISAQVLAGLLQHNPQA